MCARSFPGPVFAIRISSAAKKSDRSRYQLRRIRGPEVTALHVCYRHCGKRRVKVRVERLGLRRTAPIRGSGFEEDRSAFPSGDLDACLKYMAQERYLVLQEIRRARKV